MKTGIDLIVAERLRQVSEEGWTPEHDARHEDGEIAIAAACYATPQPIHALITETVPCGCREACCHHLLGQVSRKTWKDPWPWEESADKRKKHDRIKQLTIAGALIAAEIDRLQRANASEAMTKMKNDRSAYEREN